MHYPSIASKAALAGGWGVILLGLSIPISVALDNILLGVLALLWLLSGYWRDSIQIVRVNPVAGAAVLLFAMLALGVTYTEGSPGVLFKYIDLLFVPVFLVFLRDAMTRQRALCAFGIAALASVLVSHLAYLDLLSQVLWFARAPENPYGFKPSITHSLIVALAAYTFALLARDAQRPRLRIAYIALALFAAHNVVFMILSRTGYVVLTVLFLYFFATTFGRRGLLAITAASMAIFFAAYLTSDIFRGRVEVAATETAEWHAANPSTNSVGLRLEFYTASLEIIRQHPWLGSGTGSFPAVYARAVADQHRVPTENPHNEYLLIAVQTGLAGLACLIYLFIRQWQFAGRLGETLYRDLGRGVVLTFAVGCLFNSLLIDHTEGLLFAWLSGLAFSAPVKETVPQG